MMGVTHLLVSASATSLILGTADPSIIMAGAIAGLLPDVDISTSPAGKVLPWISNYLEKRFPHRSCTHSLMATIAIAIVSYTIAFFLGNDFLLIAHAINVGYFFGWFIDTFTRGGVEMFYPSPVRCVCPSDRNMRLRTGSNAEYGVLIFVVAVSFAVFSLNSNGGLLTSFNRLIASESGVVDVYNKAGSTHLVIAHIQGVRSSDRAPVLGDYLIVQTQGLGFLVEKDTAIYKAGTEGDVQIIVSKITADIDKPGITAIETLSLNEQVVTDVLDPFNRQGAMVFVSGSIIVDDIESLQIIQDPYQFPTIRASGTTISLEAAPLAQVLAVLGEQFASGSLSVRSINA
jgi:inner membrane protein